MVCSGNYVRKAEERKGGAGYEGTIVTSLVVRSTATVKFIPLVRDNPAEPLVPDFLGPRLWLGFRDDALYAERLEELVRELQEVPRFRKPPLGRPAFLLDRAEAEAQPTVVPLVLTPQPVLTTARFKTTQGLLLRQGDQWRLEKRPLEVEGYREELVGAAAESPGGTSGRAAEGTGKQPKVARSSRPEQLELRIQPILGAWGLSPNPPPS